MPAASKGSGMLHKYDTPAGVRVFSTTRHGGVSTGNYGTFNVNAYCGDRPEAIAENRRLLCREIGLDSTDRLIIPHQTHGTAVRQITADFFGLTAEQRQALLEGVDAVMTHLPHTCVGVSTADCIPIILYDEPHHAACAVHAGWRGTVGRIVNAAVSAMADAYGTRPQQLLTWIGPGISLGNFEVGQEVYDCFRAAGFPMELISRRYEKWHIDLPLCNRLLLEALGTPAASISDAGICTFDHVDDYFSARRLGISSGRIYTGVTLF